MRKNNFVGTFVGSSSQTLLSKAGTTLITESVEIKITKESKNIYLIRVSYPNITYEVLGSLIYDKIYSSNSNPLPKNDVNLLNTYYNVLYFNSKGNLRNHSSGMLDGKQYARISKLKRTSSS
jgi:hypothetical protein